LLYNPIGRVFAARRLNFLPLEPALLPAVLFLCRVCVVLMLRLGRRRNFFVLASSPTPLAPPLGAAELLNFPRRAAPLACRCPSVTPSCSMTIDADERSVTVAEPSILARAGAVMARARVGSHPQQDAV